MPFDEMEMWKAYKATGDQRVLGEIVEHLKPKMERNIKAKFSRANIPYSAIRAKGMALTVDAINTYDPTKGRALSSHAFEYWKKLHRYVDQQKQPVRISESQSGKVAPYLETVKQMEDRLGREPSSQELADELGWNIRDINKMKREITFEVPITSWEGFQSIQTTTHEDDLLDNVYKFDMSPEEQFIFEHSTGYNNAEKLAATDIAQRLNILPSQVSQKKKAIAKKIEFRRDQASIFRIR